MNLCRIQSPKVQWPLAVDGRAGWHHWGIFWQCRGDLFLDPPASHKEPALDEKRLVVFVPPHADCQCWCI